MDRLDSYEVMRAARRAQAREMGRWGRAIRHAAIGIARHTGRRAEEILRSFDRAFTVLSKRFRLVSRS